MEANAASSRKDFKNKIYICKKNSGNEALAPNDGSMRTKQKEDLIKLGKNARN